MEDESDSCSTAGRVAGLSAGADLALDTILVRGFAIMLTSIVRPSGISWNPAALGAAYVARDVDSKKSLSKLLRALPKNLLYSESILRL